MQNIEALQGQSLLNLNLVDGNTLKSTKTKA